MRDLTLVSVGGALVVVHGPELVVGPQVPAEAALTLVLLSEDPAVCKLVVGSAVVAVGVVLGSRRLAVALQAVLGEPGGRAVVGARSVVVGSGVVGREGGSVRH